MSRPPVRPGLGEQQRSTARRSPRWKEASRPSRRSLLRSRSSSCRGACDPLLPPSSICGRPAVTGLPMRERPSAAAPLPPEAPADAGGVSLSEGSCAKRARWRQGGFTQCRRTRGRASATPPTVGRVADALALIGGALEVLGFTLIVVQLWLVKRREFGFPPWVARVLRARVKQPPGRRVGRIAPQTVRYRSQRLRARWDGAPVAEGST